MAEDKSDQKKVASPDDNKNRFVGFEAGKDNPTAGVLAAGKPTSREVSDDGVKELLEKNLKWSQIIYEQNRKIRRHLLWSAIGGWVRIFIFLVPFIIAGVYLWPIYKNTQGQLLDLLSGNATAISGGSATSNAALKSLMKVLPLSDEQQAQVNALLENNQSGAAAE